MKTRGFEVAKGFEEKNISLPSRSTKHSAGYDFEASETIEIPSIWEEVKKLERFSSLTSSEQEDIVNIVLSFVKKDSDKVANLLDKKISPVLVPTGVKAYMGENEYLQIVNRSSGPIKRGLILTNGVGVIDSDYYNNPGNDGHIMGQFINISLETVVIKKGDRVFQGVFHQFLTADGDNANGERIGGHGSTN